MLLLIGRRTELICYVVIVYKKNHVISGMKRRPESFVMRCPLVRLCVAALALDSFCGIREALYGVFDGDRNVEVPYLLQCTMGDVLAEELHRSQRQEDCMTNTFLTMQR